MLLLSMMWITLQLFQMGPSPPIECLQGLHNPHTILLLYQMGRNLQIEWLQGLHNLHIIQLR